MDINKEFEKLAEEFEKEWHDGHEPQGIDDQYVEEMEDGEEIEEASKSDIQSFGKKLSDYAKKSGGIDKDDFKFIAKEAIGGHLPNPNSLSRMDTEPREVVLNLMAKEFGRKFVEKEYKTRFTNPKDYKEEVEEKIDMSKAGYGGSRHKKIEKDKYNKKRKGQGLEDEVEKESRAYLNRKDDDEKEKKRKGLTPMSQKKKRWGSSGYGKGEEVEEGIKDLPPHLQKSLKDFEKKQKALKKQFPELKTKTFVYNPETGKPDIEVKEDYDKNQLLRVQHDERLIAEAGDICSLDKSDLRSKSMQKVWDKKCSPEKHKKSIFGKISKGLDLYNQNSIGEQKMEKLVDTVRKVLMGEGEGDQAEYQKKRKAVAKKFGVESCSALKDEKEKKACYKALDDAHVADHEEQVELEKMKKEGVGELSDKELKIKMKDASTQKETEAACGEMGKRRLKMEKKKVAEKTMSKLFSHVRKLMSK